MKKTAIAAALLLATGAANAATITSFDVVGDFNMGQPVSSTDGMNDWSGIIPAGTAADGTVIIDNAFNFNNAFGMVDIIYMGSFGSIGGNDDGGVFTLDLSGFGVDYNGTDIAQGPNAGTLVTSADTGAQTFSASWQSTIVGGPFDGNVGYWEMSGSYTTATSEVPVPAAVWLFGSGLVGLAGIARRRKAA